MNELTPWVSLVTSTIDIYHELVDVLISPVLGFTKVAST